MATPADVAEAPLNGVKLGVAPQIRKMAITYPELTNSEIARAVGCSPQNVSCVLTTFLAGTSPDALRDFQENKADLYDAIQFRLLSSLTQEKIDKSKPMEAITGAAILEDKARLVRGQATGINMNVMVDAVEAMRLRANQQAIGRPSASKPDGSSE